MVSRRFAQLVFALLAFGALGVGLADTAAAQTPDPACSMIVSDPAQVLQRAADVEVEALALPSGNVHIRVESSLDSAGSADPARERFEQLLARCSTWRDGGDGRTPDLFVVLLLPNERETGVYYGSQFTALDPHWRTISEESMNPLFQSSEYDEGLIQGIRAMARLTTDWTPTTYPPSDMGYPPVEYGDAEFAPIGPDPSDNDGVNPAALLVPIAIIGAIGVAIAKARGGASSSARANGGAAWSAGIFGNRQGSHDAHHGFGGSSFGSSHGSSHGSEGFGGGGGGSSDSGSGSGDSGGGSTSW